jgi:transcriptional regulator with AAA-type ATPase domain
MYEIGQKQTSLTFQANTMSNQITATVVDDETILLDGSRLTGKDEVADRIGFDKCLFLPE